MGHDCDDFHLKRGDTVFGHLQFESTTWQGSCCEYLGISTNDLAKIENPDAVSSQVAVASTVEGMTAL